MYSDYPEPSGFFVSFNIFFIVILVLVPVLTLGSMDEPLSLTIFLLLSFIVPLLIFVALIHAAYNTRYTIQNNILEMKCGFIMKGKIEIDQILDIKKSRFNSKTLGSGIREKGYCNRFTGGLLLLTNNGKIYISPSDNDRFQYELELKRKTGYKQK